MTSRLSFTVLSAAGLSLLLSAPAFAQTAGGCSSTYSGALTSDIRTNGPVHNDQGSLVIGDTTPGALVLDATSATVTVVRCAG